MWCLGTSASLLMLTLMSHIFTESTIYKPFSTRTSPLGDPFEHGFLTCGIPDFNQFNEFVLGILPWSPNPNSTASTNIQEAHQNSAQPHATEIQPSRASNGAQRFILAVESPHMHVRARLRGRRAGRALSRRLPPLYPGSAP